MARRTGRTASTGRVVLVVDDNAEYLATVERLLARDGHRVLTAVSGADALELLRDETVDLVLVDYFMPGMTGEDFVVELRRSDPMIQVVLQTGFATEQPPRQMLRRLDIQGYHDKNDGPEKLRLWVDVGLKAAGALASITKSRAGLRYVISITPELHRLQPLEGLLRAAIGHTSALLAGAIHGPSPVVEHHGFVAMVDPPQADLAMRAGVGRWKDAEATEGAWTPVIREAMQAAIATASIVTVEGATIVPLRGGDAVSGAIYVERSLGDDGDRELLEVLANQVAMAIQNVSLYELAATDALTGIFSRRFLEQSLLRALHATGRSGGPVSLLAVDLDDMKTINDVGGHPAGDRALMLVARVLREQTRASDIVGRVGGDEFLVVLPDTDADGAAVVVERIGRAMAAFAVDATHPVRISVGAATTSAPWPARVEAAEFFARLKARLIDAADERLYLMKRRRVLARVAEIAWEAVETPRALAS